MKFFYLLLTSSLISLVSLAQQDPQFSQNMFSRLSINPAYAGSNGAICATLIGRNQWVGFEGAPKTGILSLDAPVSLLHGGLGLNLGYDELGFEQTMSFRLAYAYRLEMPSGNLGIGIDAGIMQKSIEGNFIYNDLGDPSIPASGSGISATAPDFSLGVYYNNDNLFVGFSSTHLSEGDLKYGTVQSAISRHYYIMAGYSYDLTSSLTLKPSTLIKTDAASTQFDLNINALYNNQFWGGLSYRMSDAIVAMVGLNITDNLKFGYAYDITTSALKKHSSNTHEIMLSYCFNVKTSPKQPTIHGNTRDLPDVLDMLEK